MNKKIAILGAGSWGIALSQVLWDNGNEIYLWEFDSKVAEKLDKERKLEDKLPGIELPKERYFISSNLREIVEDKDYIVIVVPSIHFRNTVKELKKYYKPSQIIISATKGLENDTYKVMTQIVEELIPEAFGKIVALSGPSHAEEVIRRMPTTIVSASKNLKVSEEVQTLFSNRYFRVYSHYDEVGVQIAAAVKNIIAIATGIADGIGLGDNAKAALITRGLVEIVRLGRVLGAQQNTILGLAGVGDLIVTCTSKHSRNRYVGEELGKGKKLDEILASMKMVAEGVYACKSVYNLSKKLNIDMPIVEQTYMVLFENKPIKTAIEHLMNRDLKNEGFY